MYKSYDMHLNTFWNYNGNPHWENNITKAFINTLEILNEDEQISLFNNLLGLDFKDDENIELSFELQNLRSEKLKEIKANNYNKYLMTLNPSGNTWDERAKKTLNEISKNDYFNFKEDFKSDDLTDKKIISELKKLNLITEEQDENEDLIADIIETMKIKANRGGSIPDAWILIYKENILDTVIAVESKLWDLNPYQNDNHLEKSLGISSSNSEAVRNIKFYDLCEFIQNNIDSKSKTTEDFLDYMDWLGYYNKFDGFTKSDLNFTLENDSSINILERKWNKFFDDYFESKEYEKLKEDLNIKSYDSSNRRIWFNNIKNLNVYFNTYQKENLQKESELEDLQKNSGLFVGSEIGVKNKDVPQTLAENIKESDIKELKEIYSIESIENIEFYSKIFKRLHSRQINKYFNYFVTDNLNNLFEEFLSEEHKIYLNKLKKEDAKEIISDLKEKCDLDNKEHIDNIYNDVKRYKTGSKQDDGEIKSHYDLLSYLRFIIYLNYDVTIEKDKEKLKKMFTEVIKTNYKGLKKIREILDRN